MQRADKQKGFTIVELLIVIVVIAILAAITVVSYNGIVKRTQDSAAQSSASQAQAKATAYSIENNGAYPTSLSELGLSNSSTVTYDFLASSAGPGTGYCVTISSGDSKMYVAKEYKYGSAAAIDESTPKSGTCPGYGLPPIVMVTNLVTNPSAESTHITGYEGPNSSTRTFSTARAVAGSRSLLTTMPASVASGNVGVKFFGPTSFASGGLKASTTYTASVYVYIPTGTPSLYMSIQGAGRVAASVTNPANRLTFVKNNWVRLENTFTTSTNSSGAVEVYVLNNENTPASATQFWADAFMVTEGSSTYTYADGESAGWTWNGTQHLSTSSGPAL